MSFLSNLTFAFPAALFGFAVLAVIWWFLRLIPPSPRRLEFPPVRLLAKLVQQEESPARTPWWLLLLRLALASAIILSVAHPLLDARSPFQNAGPVYIVIDDDWAAAADWEARRKALLRLTEQAEREKRPILFVRTASIPSRESEAALSYMSALEARRIFAALQPKPWKTDRPTAIDRMKQIVQEADFEPGSVYWVTNGLEEIKGQLEPSEQTKTFIGELEKWGSVAVLRNGLEKLPITLGQPDYDGDILTLIAKRGSDEGRFGFTLKAFAEGGQVLLRQPGIFEPGDFETKTQLRLPSEQYNRLTRVEIEGANHVGAVILFDERWRRRPIGLAVSPGDGAVQPLLSEHHYLARALEPYTEVREGAIEELLKRELAVVALTDPGGLSAPEQIALKAWMQEGGVLLRFAGPNLAQSNTDQETDLLPVALRAGDRQIGGAMSWGQPATLAPFSDDSPFFGLPVSADVTVQKQVLARPSLDLAEKTWARLSDGTPLVTADRRGDGWSILVHTTANAEWSDLALSGLFVDMLRRIVGLSQGVSGSGDGPPLVAQEILDGFGVVTNSVGTVQSIAQAEFEKTTVSSDHPPGFYGGGDLRRALNLPDELESLEPLAPLPVSVEQMPLEAHGEFDLRPWLLLVALVLFICDTVASLALRGLLPSRKAIAGFICFSLIGLTGVGTEADESFARSNSLQTRLAYVISGNDDVDNISKLGLTGLKDVLQRRTAAELGPPQAVDPGSDDLSFFPLLYWPIVEGYRLPNDLTAERVRAYLQSGGTILFDTRDRSGRADAMVLRELAYALNLPPLVPVPRDHVLTRSFYLLDDFPGRWTGSGVWIEKAGERVNDGVASVISGGHDWAGAWAVDEMGRPLLPVLPGGERQRELAYRFGVNLVMYTLTGNYKADQVHLPAILERIGQ